MNDSLNKLTNFFIYIEVKDKDIKIYINCQNMSIKNNYELKNNYYCIISFYEIIFK